LAIAGRILSISAAIVPTPNFQGPTRSNAALPGAQWAEIANVLYHRAERSSFFRRLPGQFFESPMGDLGIWGFSMIWGSQKN